MITDKDVQKLSEAFATKEDLKGLATKDDLKSLATKEDLKDLATKKEIEKLATAKNLDELAGDVVKVHKKVEELEERVKGIPTRDEFPALLEKAFSFATLKAEHERMKKIIREKLQVEV